MEYVTDKMLASCVIHRLESDVMSRLQRLIFLSKPLINLRVIQRFCIVQIHLVAFKPSPPQRLPVC